MSEKRFGIFRRRSRTKAYGMVTADPVILSALSIIDGSLVSYGTAYRQLAPLRTVVDFLADNVADTPLKQYRRTPDGRPELYEHPMAVLLRNPAPGLTGRRLIWGTVADRAIYGQAYWRKIPAIRPKALVPLPPPRVTPVGGDLLEPQAYDFYPVNGATPIRIPRDQIVHFRSYDPEDRRIGSSKVEALRNVLREEVEASRYRTGFWTNHARIEGVLEHPGSISQDALTRLQAQFDQAYTGYENSGRTAILEEGMSFKGVGYSARDAEFVQGRQFVLEVCCRIYNVPLSLLGLSQTATYASQKEFHRQLYTEVLPPWFSEVESEIDAQLLPSFDDTRGVYSEFTVESKLRGDFSQQAEYLSKALGGGSTPGFMTISEVREKLNLPRLEDPRADALIVPLNVSLGGEEEAEEPEEEEVPLRAAALRHFFERQERAVLTGGNFDRDRWNRELTDLVHDKTLAERINLTTEFDLAVAEDPREAFERARNERALELAEER